MSPEEKNKYYEEVSKHNAANIAEWLGAILRYCLFFGKRKFTTLYNAQEYRKNAIIGNLIQLIVLIALVGTAIWMFA